MEGLTNTALFWAMLPKRRHGKISTILLWCLYFTPGNFREASADLSLYTDAYLDRNPVLSRYSRSSIKR